MTRLNELKSHLKRGNVYRRDEFKAWSKSVDRHLEQLTEDGTLEKLSQGLYYFPKLSAFGKTPPDEEVLVHRFLKDNRFLLVSPNSYNSLGVGTTQLYNKKMVYNHKRHGEFKFGNRVFEFHLKHHFPKKVTEEFLLVDLVNNLDQVAEDRDEVLNRVFTKAYSMELNTLKHFVMEYGSSKTKKLFSHLINKSKVTSHAGLPS